MGRLNNPHYAAALHVARAAAGARLCGVLCRRVCARPAAGPRAEGLRCRNFCDARRRCSAYSRARKAVGAHFGVVLVLDEVAGERVVEYRTEVATFRHDGAYSDGRRPDAVRFSDWTRAKM